MARFLVAWEFGEDLGHLRRVLPIGRALRGRGHDVAFAFRDAARLDAPAREGFRSWPAPLLRRPATVEAAPANAADVLLNLGFRDVASLRGVQRAWDALLAVERPHAMVCDYAPCAMLAAARHGVRAATVGSGFALPPASDPFPAIRPGAHTGDALRLIDDELRRNVAQATEERWAAHLDALFRGEENLLTTWPELDPLGPRDADYLGPMPPAAEGMEAQWVDAPPRRVLAYLKPRDPRFEALLAALHASGVQAIVAAPGMPEEDAAQRSTQRVRVFAQVLRLQPLLPGIDLCIGHGGPGFAADALRAGVPLLLVPLQFEQELVARRLVQQGLAVMPAGDASTLQATLAAALGDEALRQRARRFADELAARPLRDPALEAAARLERLVN